MKRGAEKWSSSLTSALLSFSHPPQALAEVEKGWEKRLAKCEKEKGEHEEEEKRLRAKVHALLADVSNGHKWEEILFCIAHHPALLHPPL